MKNLLLKSWCITLFIIIVTSFIVLYQPFILDKIIPQGDYKTHIRWAYQFYISLGEGSFYPRWAFAAHSGLGEPAFLYYQPLFYYFVSSFNYFLNDIVLSVRISLIISNILLGIAGFLSIYRLIPLYHAWFGMILIQATPMLIFLESYYAALPWVFASPFIVFFVSESTKDNPSPMKLAIHLALLTLSHILSAMMILISIGLASVLSLVGRPSQEKLRRSIQWLTGVTIGLLLTSFYLLPALTLQDLISPQAWINASAVDWHRAFAFPIFSYLKNGLRWFAVQWPFSLLALIMFLVALKVVSRVTDVRSNIVYRLLGYSATALFFSSELSYPLYSVIGFLQKIQQPYRFIVPATLYATLAISACLSSLWPLTPVKPYKILGQGAVMLAFLLVAMVQFGLYKEGLPSPALSIAMKGTFGQPEYFPATKGPNWMEYVNQGGWNQECINKQIICTDEQKSTHAWSALVTAKNESIIRLPLFFFPNWHAALGDKRHDIVPDHDTGLISMTVPQGSHRINVTWDKLPVEYIGLSLTLLGLIAIIWLSFGQQISRWTKKEFFRQFGKFSAVGAFGTICHYLLLILMVSGFNMSPSVSAACGASLGAFVNYWLNKSITFRSQRRHCEALPRFMLLAVLGILLNASIVAWLTSLAIFYLIAQIVATGFILMLNFIFSRYWVFQGVTNKSN